MSMRVEMPERATRATFEFRGEGGTLNDDEEFFDFCARNPDLNIERLANGKIIVTRGSGLETAFRNCEISGQLGTWSEADGRGVAFGSSAEFMLASGTAFAADASWIFKSRLAKLTKEQKKQFGRLCPDFVVELRSPSDRLSSPKAKMEEWMRNGAQLAWLIDADHGVVSIYRPGKPVEELRGADAIDGEGPVEGFRLDLEPVWQGL
jgi:Uma2 family endonuclease